MKPFDVKNNTYIDSGKKINDQHPKLKVGDHISISKYKNIFAKGYTPIWPRKTLPKTLSHEHMLLMI